MDCPFCELIDGDDGACKKGYPFLPIHETEHTLSFLSVDFPAHEDGHLLVIPKEHYKSLEDVPESILSDLVNHVSLAAEVTRDSHDACNILLNNGEAAGQYVMHVHFHIVPRDPDDDIEIEEWDKKDMPKKKFVELSKRLRKGFKERS